VPATVLRDLHFVFAGDMREVLRAAINVRQARR
jgi:hypothetical protein